jgi:hypothetical protein
MLNDPSIKKVGRHRHPSRMVNESSDGATLESPGPKRWQQWKWISVMKGRKRSNTLTYKGPNCLSIIAMNWCRTDLAIPFIQPELETVVCLVHVITLSETL